MTSAGEPFIEVPDSIDAPSRARTFVAGYTRRFEQAARDIVELLVSELVTNAHRHGRPPVRVGVTVRRSVVRVEVHDSGPGFTAPSIGVADLASSGGWGLGIVGAFAAVWGITDDVANAGKTVWFEVDTTGPFPALPGISR